MINKSTDTCPDYVYLDVLQGRDFYSKHQKHPHVNVPGLGSSTLPLGLYRNTGNEVVALELCQNTTPCGRDGLFARTNNYGTAKYTEVDLIGPAYDLYVTEHELCFLSEYLEVVPYQKRCFDKCVPEFAVDVMIRALEMGLNCADWNKHSDTVRRITATYKLFRDVFVLDQKPPTP